MAASSRGWTVVDPTSIVADYPGHMLTFADEVGDAWWAGEVTVPWPAGGPDHLSDLVTVQFPAGRFTAPPVVIVTPAIASNGYMGMADQVTATGCRVGLACIVNQNQITPSAMVLAIQAD